MLNGVNNHQRCSSLFSSGLFINTLKVRVMKDAMYINRQYLKLREK